MDVQLKVRRGNKKSRLTFLTEQFHARVSCGNPRLYPGLGSSHVFICLTLLLLPFLSVYSVHIRPSHPTGDEFRNKFGKLRVTPKDKGSTVEDYLVRLIKAMIGEDADVVGLDNSRTNNCPAEYIRLLPSISSSSTNPKAVALKAELTQHICILATPKDDPVYLQLRDKYVGCVLYDNETRASHKLFRVVAIQYVQSYTAGRLSCWEATCEPIYRDAATGKFVVPHELLVEGSGVIHTNALMGYALAEYPNGGDEDPTFLPWLDHYINHFQNVIAPKYVQTIAQDLPSNPTKSTTRTCHPTRNKDLPSLTKDLPSTSIKDLPSSSQKPCRRRNSSGTSR